MTTQQPINYTIEEVDGLLDPANKVIRDFDTCVSKQRYISAQLPHHVGVHAAALSLLQ